MLMIRWKCTKWEEATYISENTHVKHNDYKLHTNCKTNTPVNNNLRGNSTCKLLTINSVGEIVINEKALILHNVHEPQIHLGRAAESHRLCGFLLRPRFMTPINSLFHFQIFQSIVIDFLFFKTFLCIVWCKESKYMIEMSLTVYQK